MTPWQIVRRVLLLTLAGMFCLFALDYGYLRIRMIRRKPADPLETMTRTRVLAILQKNGKYDYQIDAVNPVESITCVHSLFPHFGDLPCWYLKPRLNQPIPIS